MDHLGPFIFEALELLNGSRLTHVISEVNAAHEKNFLKCIYSVAV